MAKDRIPTLPKRCERWRSAEYDPLCCFSVCKSHVDLDDLENQGRCFFRRHRNGAVFSKRQREHCYSSGKPYDLIDLFEINS